MIKEEFLALFDQAVHDRFSRRPTDMERLQVDGFFQVIEKENTPEGVEPDVVFSYSEEYGTWRAEINFPG